jgi:tetratricopeptide (TPR) repeat protein
MGDWHYENNQLEQAAKYADQAIKLDPQNYEARLLRGAIARMQGDTKTAQQQLETAHLLAPTNSVVLNHLALVLADQDDEDSHKRALQFAEILYRLSPYSMDAVSTLGWANYRLGNTAEAERLFRTFSTTNQMPLDTGYFQATMLKDQGRVQQAAALLALVLNSESPFVYRRQAEEMLAQLKKGSAGPPSIEKAGEKN